MGWRFQIPMLRSLGYRVVAPDMLGYGCTDAPRWSEETAQRYSFRQAALDIQELARQLGCQKIILGGHDWGGMVVQRTALFLPELVSHVFLVCTPYVAPQRHLMPAEEFFKTKSAKTLGYQIQFGSGQLEEHITTRDELRQLLNALYGHWATDSKGGAYAFSPEKGVLFDRLHEAVSTTVLSSEEMEYYLDEFGRHGIHGPLNWYRTRELNWKNDQAILNRTISVPVLFIGATKDPILGPHIWAGMEKHLPRLTIKAVDSGHWLLWDRPQEVNGILANWLRDVETAAEAPASKI
ncbi:hypothetical protein KEM52_002975 [Ascosphaera acerosa]|nr:hypothetical protein KEM52_002975 [Ascosphaera acerosa]